MPDKKYGDRGSGIGGDGYDGFDYFDDDVFGSLPPIPKKYLREFSSDTEASLIEIGTDGRGLESVIAEDDGDTAPDEYTVFLPQVRRSLPSGKNADFDNGTDTEAEAFAVQGINEDRTRLGGKNSPSGERGGAGTDGEQSIVPERALPQTRSASFAPSPDAESPREPGEVSGVRRRTAEDDEISELFARLRSRNPSAQSRSSDTGFSVSLPRSSSMKDTGLIRSYSPRHPFLHHVDILAWPSSYTFYERFRADAVSFFSREGREVPYADFVSYVPQYSMMTSAQLGYYFWWRSCLRGGRLIKASRSYVLLFLYEVINLPDLILPEEGIELLCRVIIGYAETVVGIRNSVVPWLRDYCLIHGVSLPEKYMRDIASFAGRYSALPEFFVCYDTETGKPDPLSLASALSHYSWQDSKYMTPAGRGTYERYMPGAILAAMEAWDGAEALSERQGTERYIAESYSGAVCSSEVKCRLRIDYTRAADSEEADAVTAAVKYAENQVRRLLGIKSRFKISSLPEGMREAVDAYFAPVLAREESSRRRSKKAAVSDVSPEYEHFYAPESRGMSFDRALEIERSSWRMTERLENAFSEDRGDAYGGCFSGAQGGGEALRTAETDGREGGGETGADIDSKNGLTEGVLTERSRQESGLPESALSATPGTDGGSGESPEIAGLELLLRGDSEGFERYARSVAALPAALCDRINELLYDEVCDSVAELTASGYAIIEDYRGEAEEYVREHRLGEVE